MNSLRIAIVGAGLGGLCLAQNLKQRGMRATVFERDRSAWDRPQGYRLHLDADGINALHDSLSSRLYQLFDATAMKAEPFTTIVDTALAVRARRPHYQHGGTAAREHVGLPAHVNVDRGTLREILLADIDVQWNKGLRSYDESERGVTLLFTEMFCTCRSNTLCAPSNASAQIVSTRAGFTIVLKRLSPKVSSRSEQLKCRWH